jgi:membrane protease YdiL (CAAX protease family)
VTEPRTAGPDGEMSETDPAEPGSSVDIAEAESTDGTAPGPGTQALPGDGSPVTGPPGVGIFSLDRPASGLYLVAWLLTGLGLATLFVGIIATTAGAQLAFAGLLMVSSGLAAACGYQVVLRRVTRQPSAYRGPSPVLGFFAAAALSACLAVILGLLGLLGGETGAGFLLGLIVVAAGYLVVVVFFVVRTGAMSWIEMGWPAGPGRIGQLVGDAAFGLLVTVPVVVPVLIGAGILASLLDVQPTGRIPSVEGALASAVVVFGAAVVAPIAEELFFRGYALSAWQRDLGPRPALVRSAVFFALVHIANVGGVTFGDAAREAILQVAVIVPLGFVLGWVYQRHGIGAAIAGHMGYNATLLALAGMAGQLGFVGT